jgi:hypothetical protein
VQLSRKPARSGHPAEETTGGEHRYGGQSCWFPHGDVPPDAASVVLCEAVKGCSS